MYKVFFNQRKLIISREDKSLISRGNLIYYHDSADNLKSLIHFFYNRPSFQKLIIFGDDPYQILIGLKSALPVIKAGGGIVLNDVDDVLFIFRRGKWDLPKGKKEPHESEQDCAIREVKEECGIKSLEITGKLPVSYHIYELKGEIVLKETHWYKMFTTEKELSPQTEEDITRAEWFERGQIDEVLQNTWGLVSELIHDSGMN